MTPLERIEDALTLNGAAHEGTNRWTCPAQEHHNAALTVDPKLDGTGVLLMCHGGCEADDVLSALNLSWADLEAPRETPYWAVGGHDTGEYPYTDELGALLYTVRRGEGKRFSQAAADGTPSVKGIRKVLFNLPSVLTQIEAGGVVDLCEGEKDAHALKYAGLVPACNSGGAKGWRDELADSLRGALMVRVWRDKDEPGAEWARCVTASLTAREIPYKVVQAAEGKDAWDHFAAGYTLEEAEDADLSAAAPGDTSPRKSRTGEISRDGRVKVSVASHAEAADWLRIELGTGALSGMFSRDGLLVRVPRIGEAGYLPPSDNEPDEGPARIDRLNISQVKALVDVRYDCGVNKESKSQDGKVSFSWENRLFPKPAAESAVTGAEMGEGTPNVLKLLGVTHTPAVRKDWSVIDTPGYDRATGLLFLPPASMGPVTVPNAPTAEEIKRARDLVVEPVAQFPFVSEDHRANWVGAMLTPLLRRVLPPPYPMVVITATNRGSGKGFLAGMLRAVHGGMLKSEMPREAEELRKAITATLLTTTAPVITWDNLSGIVRSSVLEALLTTAVHSDRELGANKNLVLANDRLWTATANNASFGGDMDRRTLAVALDPPGPDQHLRTDFRLHPVHWVEANKSAYLGALLTLVRGWVGAGCPTVASRSDDYGQWSAALGGLLTWAQVPGTFGGGGDSVSDADGDEWGAFLQAVYEVMGPEYFRMRDLVTRIAVTGSQDGIPTETLPSELADLFARTGHNKGGFIKSLGRWFTNRDGRYVSGWKSEMSRDRKNGHRYRVCPPKGGVSEMLLETPNEPEPQGGYGAMVVDSPTLTDFESTSKVLMSNIDTLYTGRPGDSTTKAPNPPPERNHPVTQSSEVGFDLETADAECLYVGTYEGSYVRLAASTVSEAPVPVRELKEALAGAETVYGHNVLGFDIQALARHEGADYMSLATKAVDTLVLARLADPPGAKGMQPWSGRGYYGLDAVAARLGVSGKTDNLALLAKEFGGYDKIPVDDSRYVSYLQGDVEATQAVYERLTDGGLSAYAAREMRVVALQNLMTVNGCAVDTDLLSERVKAEQDRRADAVHSLSEEFGLPLTTPGGRESAKPWTTKAGKEALERAFTEAGAQFLPRTATGAPKLGKDSLGEGTWVDHTGKARPGLLRAYGDLPAVRRIVDLLLSASGSTDKYAEVLKYLTPEGRVHPAVGDLQASGRWAYIRPSLTNVGKRGKALHQREVLVAEPGCVLMAFDFDQVDMRAVAGHSQDREYMKLFEPGRDAHSEVADAVFGRHDGEFRDKSKAIGHGWNYGRGVTAIAESTGIPLDTVVQFDTTMRERFPVLMDWKRAVADLGGSGQLLDNGFGRLMRCDPTRSFTQAPALMGQGGARDIMCEGLLRLPEWTWPMLRLVIHDEVLLSVPEESVGDVQAAVLEAFTMEFKGVPVTAGVAGPARNWRAVYGK